MNLSKGQGELFTENSCFKQPASFKNELRLKKSAILEWQKRINDYQKALFKHLGETTLQKSIFDQTHFKDSPKIPNFLEITPLPLSFWRWPKLPHHGPAIYLVMDKLKDFNSHILLYIGETVAAEKRWKGDHDCKEYLQLYCETCQKAGLRNQLSIRFWQDVPEETKKRRVLEQQLIQKWLPAFNKETRIIWNTPFTNEIN